MSNPNISRQVTATDSMDAMGRLIDASLAATFGDRPTGFRLDGSFGGDLGISQIPEQGRKRAEQVLGSLNGFHYVGDTVQQTVLVSDPNGLAVPMQTRRTVYTKVLDK